MTEKEIKAKTKQIAEDIISDPKSEIYPNATAYGIEDAVVIIQPDSFSMVLFEDHPKNAGKQHFISTYKIDKRAYKEFRATLDGVELPPELVDRISEWPNLSVSKTIGENGETIHKTRGPNMGEGVLERERRKREQKTTLSPTAPPTYDSILPEFRMSNQQINDAENLRKEVQQKSLVLNEQETKLLKRFRGREKELVRLEKQSELDNQGEL